jgi:hypothetical protein
VALPGSAAMRTRKYALLYAEEYKLGKFFLNLPSYQKRDAFADFLLQMSFSPDMKRSDDDGYCYYLCFKWSLIVCLLFSLMNWVSYAYGVSFDLLLFKIHLDGNKVAYQFVMSYPFYVSGVVALTCLPFFFFKSKG